MRSDKHPTRSSALSATATTLVALVAVSAAVASPAPKAAESDARTESNSQCMTCMVRVVAAAVAAAARDMLGSDRSQAALILMEPAGAPTGAAPARLAESPVAPALLRLLAERLLDLPPPAC